MIATFSNRASVIALAAATFLEPCLAGTAAEVEQGFRHPPDSARPWAYWFVMDGNLTREGITADFEAMKHAGLGGLIFMEVDAGIPRGPVKFMSPEWRRLLAHAVREAERLGLQVTLNAGPGWTGSGGPWVKPEQSMQHIVASAIDVTGPTNFAAALPQPSPRAPYFGNAGLPPELLKAKDEFYVDVAVLALPKPAAAHPISDIDEKALYVRHPYSSRPGTKPFLPAPAIHPSVPPGAVIARAAVVDLTAQLGRDGRLSWDVPDGTWTILRFGRVSTGANTRPAPAPGLGLECDKFDQAALDAHFDAFVGALLREIGPRQRSGEAGWNMLHIDSWEMGAQNWTAGFRHEFQRRRGYDPLPYLPAVTGRVVESLEVSERFLWDLRQTAQELVIENHAQHLKELGRRHGFGLSIEPYDMNPCSDMTLGGVADVPMCEFWAQGYGFATEFSCFEAVSVAHTLGRPIVAAESFTSGDRERWQLHPGAIKAQGDWALCAGINRIVFHRYQHQPWLDRRPGMTMGPYGVHWERTQTWWDMVPAYHEYLARCQFLLRRGLPVADICYLSAEGAPHVWRPPPSATRGNPPDRLGYNFDGCAPEALLARMSVQDGRLVLPDGMSYRVLVLPERDTITPQLLRKVRELVAAGATVIGPRPSKSPSLSGYPQCDEEVRQLAGELWGDCDGERIKEHRLGAGRVVWERAPNRALTDDPDAPLEQAKWIWHREGNPASSAPVGKRYFRRVVTLENESGVQSARFRMTADNSFELFVNGRRAGHGDNFHQAYTFDVTRMLGRGSNVLAVLAENDGEAPNPAALIGMLAVEFRDGSRLKIATDRQWQTARSVQATWASEAASVGNWSSAMELGPLGMAPWKTPGKPASEPEQYGDFTIVSGVLKQMGVAPDFESDGPLRYTHRRDGAADIYFVANREERSVQAHCSFRVAGKAPELWDPMTGRIVKPAVFHEKDGRTSLPLWLEPAGSVFVVFRPDDAEFDPVVRVIRNGQVLAAESGQQPAIVIQKALYGVIGDPQRTRDVRATLQTLVDSGERHLEVARLADDADPAVGVVKTLVADYSAGGQSFTVTGKDRETIHFAVPDRALRPAEIHRDAAGNLQMQVWRSGRYELQTVLGKSHRFEVPPLPEPATLGGPWEVRFQPGHGAPERITLDQLTDWSKHSDPGVRHFSGVATYTKEFSVPPELVVPGRRLYLDLGEVQVMARVALNGRDLGVLWKSPFRVDITDAVKAGSNALEITVANLWPNRLIGDQSLPPEQRVTWTTWNPFKKDAALLESGLIGSVTLQSAATLTAQPAAPPGR